VNTGPNSAGRCGVTLDIDVGDFVPATEGL